LTPTPIVDLTAESTGSSTGNLDKFDVIIRKIHGQQLADPTEILRFLQKELQQGRKLNIASLTDVDENDESQKTNYISIDRFNLLKSTFAELDSIENFFLTYEVDFINESAKDFGGPRREWLRLCNKEIKQKYFDHGLRDLFSDEYFYVGVLVGTCLLQGGQLPTYMPNDVLEKLFKPGLLNLPCIHNLSQGLNKLGLIKILNEFPQLLHLLRPSNKQMTPKMLLQLMKPKFSPEGTNKNVRERELYTVFVKYVREVNK